MLNIKVDIDDRDLRQLTNAFSKAKVERIIRTAANTSARQTGPSTKMEGSAVKRMRELTGIKREKLKESIFATKASRKGIGASVRITQNPTNLIHFAGAGKREIPKRRPKFGVSAQAYRDSGKKVHRGTFKARLPNGTVWVMKRKQNSRKIEPVWGPSAWQELRKAREVQKLERLGAERMKINLMRGVDTAIKTGR